MTIDTDNLTALTDSDLGSLPTAVTAEKSRRCTLATAVQSVIQTAREFVDVGGDKEVLVTAIQDLTPTTEQTAS